MKLAALDLNLVVVLDALLAEQSVSRAAKRLHSTPPAVSRALGRLRACFGDPLLTRTRGGIARTSLGEPLAGEVRAGWRWCPRRYWASASPLARVFARCAGRRAA